MDTITNTEKLKTKATEGETKQQNASVDAADFIVDMIYQMKVWSACTIMTET